MIVVKVAVTKHSKLHSYIVASMLFICIRWLELMEFKGDESFQKL